VRTACTSICTGRPASRSSRILATLDLSKPKSSSSVWTTRSNEDHGDVVHPRFRNVSPIHADTNVDVWHSPYGIELDSVGLDGIVNHRVLSVFNAIWKSLYGCHDHPDDNQGVGMSDEKHIANSAEGGKGQLMVSVRQNHIDSYQLLAAQAVGVSSGSRWMDKLASPGRTAARYSRTGVLSRRQVSTMERIAATRGPAFS
jgi:hypothetical protein